MCADVSRDWIADLSSTRSWRPTTRSVNCRSVSLGHVAHVGTPIAHGDDHHPVIVLDLGTRSQHVAKQILQIGPVRPREVRPENAPPCHT